MYSSLGFALVSNGSCLLSLVSCGRSQRVSAKYHTNHNPIKGEAIYMLATVDFCSFYVNKAAGRRSGQAQCVVQCSTSKKVGLAHVNMQGHPFCKGVKSIGFYPFVRGLCSV